MKFTSAWLPFEVDGQVIMQDVVIVNEMHDDQKLHQKIPWRLSRSNCSSSLDGDHPLQSIRSTVLMVRQTVFVWLRLLAISKPLISSHLARHYPICEQPHQTDNFICPEWVGARETGGISNVTSKPIRVWEMVITPQATGAMASLKQHLSNTNIS